MAVCVDSVPYSDAVDFRSIHDRVSWDAYFMNTAIGTSLRSPDRHTKVGCVLVKDKVQLSLGYNGLAAGIPEDSVDWFSADKYGKVIHAEMNAILHMPGMLKDLCGATAYVTLFPCNECAKALMSVGGKGISRVVYLEKRDTDDTKLSEENMKGKGIILEQYIPQGNKLEVAF